MVTVHIPTVLRRFTDGAATVEVDAPTVAHAVDGLVEANPGLRPHLLAEDGGLRPFVRLFLDSDHVTAFDADSVVGPEQGLRIVPAIAGG